MSGVAAWCPRSQCWEAATATDAWAHLQRRTGKRKGPDGWWGPVADQCNGAVWAELKRPWCRAVPDIRDNWGVIFLQIFLVLVYARSLLAKDRGTPFSSRPPSSSGHEACGDETDSDPTFPVPCSTRNAQSRVGICLKPGNFLEQPQIGLGPWVSWACQKADYPWHLKFQSQFSGFSLGSWGYNI